MDLVICWESEGVCGVLRQYAYTHVCVGFDVVWGLQMVFYTVKETYSHFELRGCGYATSLFVSIMIVLTYNQDTDAVSPF